MFTFEGKNYKSKSEVALNMLKAGKGRMEISKALGITYQTVHAIMKNAGLKPAHRKKNEKKTTTKPVKTPKTPKMSPTPAVENVVSTDTTV